MKKLRIYNSPVLVQFQKDLSVYTTSGNTTQNGGYSDFNSGGNSNVGSDGTISGPRPNATNKSTGIQDYNPFGE